MCNVNPGFFGVGARSTSETSLCKDLKWPTFSLIRCANELLQYLDRTMPTTISAAAVSACVASEKFQAVPL